MNEEELIKWIEKNKYKWQRRLDQEKTKRKYNDPEYSEFSEGLYLGWCKALSAFKGQFTLHKKEAQNGENNGESPEAIDQTNDRRGED